MYRFEPPPPPESGRGGHEPDDPYAPAPTSEPPTPPMQSTNPYGLSPGAPWGPPGANNHPRATAALVLGILGVCGFAVLGPFAWAIAQSSLNESRHSPYPVTNHGNLVAAKVLGIISSTFMVLGIFWVFMVMVAIFTL